MRTRCATAATALVLLGSADAAAMGSSGRRTGPDEVPREMAAAESRAFKNLAPAAAGPEDLAGARAIGGPGGRRPHGDGEMHGKNEIPPAARIENQIPSSIEMHLGERRSFRGVNQAGVVSNVVRLDVSGAVLTILAEKEGTCEVMIYGAARPDPSRPLTPRKIAVRVRRWAP